MQAQGLMLDRSAPSQVAACIFARAEVRREVDAVVLGAWAVLERSAPCSVYQTRAWLLPWIDTLGRKADVAPAFVIAWSADGRPLALLALGMHRRGPLRVARFLGGKDSNFSLGLYASGAAWTRADLRLLLRRAAEEMGADAFVFANQPFDWHGAVNPLATLPHQLSPSAAYGTALMPDANAFLAAKLSKDSRKKLRKKEARLAEGGSLAYAVAASSADRARAIDALIKQRLERFRSQGIASDFEDPRMRSFLERASTPATEGGHDLGLEFHTLSVGDRIVAVYAGSAHAGAWSGMVNSFDADPSIGRNSPGDLLLMKVIAGQCAAGRSRFDLGVGEARYKATFCDTAIPLFDSFVPATARGWVYVRAAAFARKIKRRVKQNAQLFAWAKRWRSRKGAALPDQAT